MPNDFLEISINDLLGSKPAENKIVPGKINAPNSNLPPFDIKLNAGEDPLKKAKEITETSDFLAQSISDLGIENSKPATPSATPVVNINAYDPMKIFERIVPKAPKTKVKPPTVTPEESSGAMLALNKIWGLAKNPYDFVKGSAEFVASVPGFVEGLVSAAWEASEALGQGANLSDVYVAASRGMEETSANWHNAIVAPLGRLLDTPKKLGKLAAEKVTGVKSKEEEDYSSAVGDIAMAPLNMITKITQEVADAEWLKDYPNAKGAIQFGGDVLGLLTLGRIYKGGASEYAKDVEPIIMKADAINKQQKVIDNIPDEILKKAQEKVLEVEKNQLELDAKALQDKIDHEKVVTEDLKTKGKEVKDIKGGKRGLLEDPFGIKDELAIMDEKAKAEGKKQYEEMRAEKQKKRGEKKVYKKKNEELKNTEKEMLEKSIEEVQPKEDVKPTKKAKTKKVAAEPITDVETYYHKTPSKNIDSILDEGFKARPIIDILDDTIIEVGADAKKRDDYINHLDENYSSKEPGKVYLAKDKDIANGYPTMEAKQAVLYAIRENTTDKKVISKIDKILLDIQRDAKNTGIIEVNIPKGISKGRDEVSLLPQDINKYKRSKVAKSPQPITDVDLQTGTALPEELSTHNHPFRDKRVEHTNSMSKIFQERIGKTDTSPEVFTRYLINEVNRYLNGEEVNIEKVRNGLSDLAINADKARLIFENKEDFYAWKSIAQDAAQWARGADRLTNKRTGGTNLNMMIPVNEAPKIVKDLLKNMRAGISKESFSLYRNKEVFDKTGFWLGKDGKWRYEIDDSELKISPKLITGYTEYEKSPAGWRIKNRRSPGPGALYNTEAEVKEAVKRHDEVYDIPLKDVITHPSLYEAVPELKDVGIRINRKMSSAGTYHPDSKIIDIKRPDKDIVVHEVQHAVNDIMKSRFKGSNPEIEQAKRAQKLFSQLTQYAKDPEVIKTIQVVKNNYFGQENISNLLHGIRESAKGKPEYEKINMATIDYLKESAYERYMKDPGEMEARLASKRMEMTAEQRKAEPPWETLDEMLIDEGFGDKASYRGKDKYGGEVYNLSSSVGLKLYSGIDPTGIKDALKKLFVDAPKNLNLHSLANIKSIADRKGDIELYHGLPTEFANEMLKGGNKTKWSSSEDMARYIAKTYDIPYTVMEKAFGTSWKGYAEDRIERISTAPPEIASRWASSFPLGEVVSSLNTQARLFIEAKRRGISYDEMYEKAWEEAKEKFPDRQITNTVLADALGLPDKLPYQKTGGSLLKLTVDARSIPEHISNKAKTLIKGVEDGYITKDEAIIIWNTSYKDIKISPNNIKNIEKVGDIKTDYKGIVPTTLYMGLDPTQIPEATKKIIAGAKALAAYTAKARGMKEWNPKAAANMLKEGFTRSFVDRSGNIRKELLDKLGDDGYEIIQKMYLSKGASSLAAQQLKQMRNEVYAGLNKNDKRILDNLILADRMLDIGKYKTTSQFKFPEGLSPVESAAYNELFQFIEKITPEKAELLKQRAQAYFEWMKKPLKDMLDAELIDQAEYDALASHNYRRLKLVDVFDKRYQTKVGKTKRTVYDSGVESLAHGRETDVFEPSSEVMALEVFNRAYGRILNNAANKTLLDLAREQKDNPFVAIKDTPADRVPSGWDRFFVYEKGERKALYLSPEMSKEWITNNPEMSYKMSQFIRYASGSPVLRTFATGIDWGFALANLPRDIMHIWYASRVFENGKWTPTYSTSMPVYFGQMGADIGGVFHDAILRKGKYLDYIKEGGGMEFLVHQGRLMQRGRHIEGGLDKVQDFLGYFGETSEIMTRLAVRDRVIKRRANEQGISYEEAYKDKKITQEATFAARDYMDFGQGGGISKALDNGLPYLNASIQGTRGMFRSFKDNPLQSTVKLAQFAALVTGLYIANQALNPETLKALKGDIAMQGNLIIPLGDGFGFDDEKGQRRYPYIKIPLDPGQKFFKMFFEASYDKATGQPVDAEGVANSLSQISPVAISSLPPTLSGTLGYMYNKDFWQNEDIWKKTDKPLSWPDSKEEYIPGKTPQALIDVGSITGLSPERLKYTLSELVTGGSMWSWLVGQGYDAAFHDLPQNKKEMHLAEVLAKTPIAKRFIGITNPYTQYASSIEQAREESMLKRWVENRGLDQRVESYLYEGGKRSDVIDYIKTTAKDQATEDRLKDRFIFQEKIKGLPNRSFWLSLKGTPDTDARAKLYVQRLESATPEEREQLRKEEAIVNNAGGVISDEFKEAVMKYRYKK